MVAWKYKDEIQLASRPRIKAHKADEDDPSPTKSEVHSWTSVPSEIQVKALYATSKHTGQLN